MSKISWIILYSHSSFLIHNFTCDMCLLCHLKLITSLIEKNPQNLKSTESRWASRLWNMLETNWEVRMWAKNIQEGGWGGQPSTHISEAPTTYDKHCFHKSHHAQSCSEWSPVHLHTCYQTCIWKSQLMGGRFWQQLQPDALKPGSLYYSKDI